MADVVRAQDAVRAGRRVGREHAAGDRVAGVDGAWDAVVTLQEPAPHAAPVRGALVEARRLGEEKVGRLASRCLGRECTRRKQEPGRGAR